MSLPELVIQEGVRRAWDFFKKNDHVLGYIAHELPVERQEEYREILRNGNVAIHFGFPNQQAPLPSFALILKGETEDREGQFIGDDGHDNREYPYPATDNDAVFSDDPTYIPRDKEEFGGVTYSLDPKRGRTLGVDPDVGRGEVRKFSPRSKNKWQQRELGTRGDEQYEHMGSTQRLWEKDTQRLTTTVVGDACVIDIVVTTNNLELTMVFFRLLRWVLRRWTTWFEVNGVQRATFSGGELRPNESLISPGGGAAFQRTLTMRYLHHDVNYEVESILAAFMLEIEMATPRQDGGLDIVKLTDWPSKK